MKLILAALCLSFTSCSTIATPDFVSCPADGEYMKWKGRNGASLEMRNFNHSTHSRVLINGVVMGIMGGVGMGKIPKP